MERNRNIEYENLDLKTPKKSQLKRNQINPDNTQGKIINHGEIYTYEKYIKK